MLLTSFAGGLVSWCVLLYSLLVVCDEVVEKYLLVIEFKENWPDSELVDSAVQDAMMKGNSDW